MISSGAHSLSLCGWSHARFRRLEFVDDADELSEQLAAGVVGQRLGK
jgi:hypothetical protein